MSASPAACSDSPRNAAGVARRGAGIDALAGSRCGSSTSGGGNGGSVANVPEIDGTDCTTGGGGVCTVPTGGDGSSARACFRPPNPSSFDSHRPTGWDDSDAATGSGGAAAGGSLCAPPGSAEIVR